MPAHKSGESVEGLKIQGHSRDPLRSKPVKKINGLKYFVYKAEFNVFAEIVAGLSPDILLDKKLDKNALIMEGETLGCDTALIITIAKNRTQKAVSHVSYTHGASEWEFTQQTNVKVVTPRQEIIDALQKRDDSIPIITTKLQDSFTTRTG
jgi:hypothetical protein